jgi:hypothetical protein
VTDKTQSRVAARAGRSHNSINSALNCFEVGLSRLLHSKRPQRVIAVAFGANWAQRPGMEGKCGEKIATEIRTGSACAARAGYAHWTTDVRA